VPGRTAVRNAVAVFIWQDGDRFVQVTVVV